ncbi:protein archease isoform X2 [Felis catus]|uniref:protein archease isoform X2 n=1 Tax=Felis catus TaxID=9685 RepID=UPI001D1A2DC3|nr:protein archease isoform X2 [Felis catus]
MLSGLVINSGNEAERKHVYHSGIGVSSSSVLLLPGPPIYLFPGFLEVMKQTQRIGPKPIKDVFPPAGPRPGVLGYLDHTADVQLHAWGDTLEEAFEQCAMAMFGYMTDTGTVEPLQTLEVETQGDDLESLLFHFLDEWLYKFSADEFFIPREVKVLHIDQRNFKLRSIGEHAHESGRGRRRERILSRLCAQRMGL